MEELLKVCKTMLDNADLDISIEVPSSTIILDFVVGGSLENIVIRCGKYFRLQVDKPAAEEQCFFVGETHIELITSRTKMQELNLEYGCLKVDGTRTAPVFHLWCDGSIMLDIVCGSLAWKKDGSEFEAIPLPATTP